MVDGEGGVVDDQKWRESIEMEMRSLHQDVANNTRITLDTRDSFKAFEGRAMPMVEITESMIKGAHVVGVTVDFIAKWGGRAWRVFLYIIGAWLAIKIITTGGSWSDAVRTFLGVQKTANS